MSNGGSSENIDAEPVRRKAKIFWGPENSGWGCDGQVWED